jgi:hypothetical protein
MPRSSGIFTLVPGYFATDGTTIEVSQHNPPLEDIAQALTDSLPRDGSAPMTGNLAMGSKKITGLAAATLASDAVRFDQLPTFTPTTATLTAGTNAQGQGPITTDQVTITVAAANPSGATLPTAVAGDRVIIANRGANPVNIYPATGAAIGALATNAPVLLAVNQSVEFFARSATQWEGQISQPLDADLTALAALASTGLVTRTAAGTMATRQIVSADGSVTITNPAGVAGDVNLSVSGRKLLATKTASASATLDFTEFNNAVYRRYEFELENVKPATDGAELGMRVSTDGGATYDAGASDYDYVGYGAFMSGGTSGASAAAGRIILNGGSWPGNAAGEFGFSGLVNLYNAPSVTAWTRVLAVLSFDNQAGSVVSYQAAGRRMAAQDTDAVRFLFSSGNIASGTIRMFGII